MLVGEEKCLSRHEDCRVALSSGECVVTSCV